MYDSYGARTKGQKTQFGNNNRKGAIDFDVLLQFQGQIFMTFLPKNCLRLQNLQGYRETELKQLGVPQWYQKKGIGCQIYFLEEKRANQRFLMVKICQEVQKTPIFLHNFGLILMIWQPSRADARFSLDSKFKYDID